MLFSSGVAGLRRKQSHGKEAHFGVSPVVVVVWSLISNGYKTFVVVERLAAIPDSDFTRSEANERVSILHKK